MEKLVASVVEPLVKASKAQMVEYCAGIAIRKYGESIQKDDR